MDPHTLQNSTLWTRTLCFSKFSTKRDMPIGLCVCVNNRGYRLGVNNLDVFLPFLRKGLFA